MSSARWAASRWRRIDARRSQSPAAPQLPGLQRTARPDQAQLPSLRHRAVRRFCDLRVLRAFQRRSRSPAGVPRVAREHEGARKAPGRQLPDGAGSLRRAARQDRHRPGRPRAAGEPRRADGAGRTGRDRHRRGAAAPRRQINSRGAPAPRRQTNSRGAERMPVSTNELVPSPAVAAPRPRPWTVFSSGPFRKLWVATTLSMFGDFFSYIAMAWLVLQMTGSSLALGTVLVVQAVPRAVLMGVGGALADRVSPRMTMLGSMGLRAVFVAPPTTMSTARGTACTTS